MRHRPTPSYTLPRPPSPRPRRTRRFTSSPSLCRLHPPPRPSSFRKQSLDRITSTTRAIRLCWPPPRVTTTRNPSPSTSPTPRSLRNRRPSYSPRIPRSPPAQDHLPSSPPTTLPPASSTTQRLLARSAPARIKSDPSPFSNRPSPLRPDHPSNAPIPPQPRTPAPSSLSPLLDEQSIMLEKLPSPLALLAMMGPRTPRLARARRTKLRCIARAGFVGMGSLALSCEATSPKSSRRGARALA